MKADQEDEPFDPRDGRDGWNRNEYVWRESVVVFPRINTHASGNRISGNVH
jgi:hypothetical protein